METDKTLQLTHGWGGTRLSLLTTMLFPLLHLIYGWGGTGGVETQIFYDLDFLLIHFFKDPFFFLSLLLYTYFLRNASGKLG